MNRSLFTLMCFLLVSWCISPSITIGQEATTFLLENFDSVTPPALPSGWSDPDARWESSSSVSSTGSGLNNIKIAGSTPGGIQSSIVDLSGMTSGTLNYLVRRTSTYEQDSLQVTASANGGTSFAVLLLDRGMGLPAADGSYEQISVALPTELIGVANAVFKFEALGGSTSGANIRIDDVEIVGEGEGGLTTSIFGFSAASSNTDPATNTFDVPLMLDYEHTENLQGLQFELAWDAGAFELSDVIRGSAILNDTDWLINFESREGELRVVLLGNQNATLASGFFDPLMTLQFTVDASNTADSSVLSLSRVLGAVSVRTGDDAGIIPGSSSHTVTLTSGEPVFSPDVLSLVLDTINTGAQSQASVTISNTGTSDLIISDIASSNTLFAVSPANGTIAAGMSEAFTVTFSPAFDMFGFQDATLTFTHNAAGGSDVISLTGTGVGGRGDASEDGLVDAVDLVLGIDYILERVVPTPDQSLSADVFPFGLPDDSLDVRDLTVMAQAIVLGLWPDDTGLPVLPPEEGQTGKHANDVSTLVNIEPVFDNGDMKLYLNLQTPIRAYQIAVQGVEANEVVASTGDLMAAGMYTTMYYEKGASSLRMLGAHFGGDVLAPGRYLLATWPAATPVAMSSAVTASPNAFALRSDGSRLSVGIVEHVISSTDEQKVKTDVEVLTPYPNPYNRKNTAGLSVPLYLGSQQHIQVQVYDVLGRQVAILANKPMGIGRHTLTWNGLDQLGATTAPGLYFLKVKTADAQKTRMVVVR